jgi:hypothetical protein
MAQATRIAQAANAADDNGTHSPQRGREMAFPLAYLLISAAVWTLLCAASFITPKH